MNIKLYFVCKYVFSLYEGFQYLFVLIDNHFPELNGYHLALALNYECVSQFKKQIESKGEQEAFKLLIMKPDIGGLSYFGDVALDGMV